MSGVVESSAPLTVSPTSPGGAGPHNAPAEAHDHSHRDTTGGWLRPTVFGAMDGLVSNTSLIAGVGGGGGGRSVLLVAGLAGLAAGAFSMATGEWTSVRAQNQLVAAEVEKERRELARNPEAERDELAAVYRRHGLSPALARLVADELTADPEVALRLHAREELGTDPDDLPSPWTAAGCSFAAFAVGALVPLVPLLLGGSLLWLCLLTAGAGALIGGGLLTLVTGRSWVRGALQQLALAAAATGVTYLLGRAVGGALG